MLMSKELVATRRPELTDDDLVTCDGRDLVTAKDEYEGFCGECGLCTAHCECYARIIRIVFSGYAGTYWQPPEDPEFVIYCPKCGTETDAVGGDTWGDEPFLTRCTLGDHDVMVEGADA